MKLFYESLFETCSALFVGSVTLILILVVGYGIWCNCIFIEEKDCYEYYKNNDGYVLDACKMYKDKWED